MYVSHRGREERIPRPNTLHLRVHTNVDTTRFVTFSNLFKGEHKQRISSKGRGGEYTAYMDIFNVG